MLRFEGTDEQVGIQDQCAAEEGVCSCGVGSSVTLSMVTGLKRIKPGSPQSH